MFLGKSRTPKRDLPEAEVARALLCPSDKSSWGLVFGWSEEYLGDAERRLSLVKSEMDDEWVDAAVEVRNISA